MMLLLLQLHNLAESMRSQQGSAGPTHSLLTALGATLPMTASAPHFLYAMCPSPCRFISTKRQPTICNAAGLYVMVQPVMRGNKVNHEVSGVFACCLLHTGERNAVRREYNVEELD